MLQLRSKYVREAKSLSDLFHHDDDSIKQGGFGAYSVDRKW